LANDGEELPGASDLLAQLAGAVTCAFDFWSCISFRGDQWGRESDEQFNFLEGTVGSVWQSGEQRSPLRENVLPLLLLYGIHFNPTLRKAAR
jgi:hypothetical protein